MKLFDKKLNKEKKREGPASGLDMLNVDLIKGEKEEVLNWGKYLGLIFLVLVVSSILVLEVYWLLNWWEKTEAQKVEIIDEDVKSIKDEISQLEIEYKELTNFKVRADLANNLLNKHPYWTNFFEWLEGVTLSSVTWESFSGDLNGKYSLSGKSNTFADISWQVKAFLDDENVLSVGATSYSGGARSEIVEVGRFENEDGEEEIETRAVLRSSVSFTLNLEINPNIFYNY